MATPRSATEAQAGEAPQYERDELAHSVAVQGIVPTMLATISGEWLTGSPVMTVVSALASATSAVMAVGLAGTTSRMSSNSSPSARLVSPQRG